MGASGAERRKSKRRRACGVEQATQSKRRRSRMPPGCERRDPCAARELVRGSAATSLAAFEQTVAERRVALVGTSGKSRRRPRGKRPPRLWPERRGLCHECWFDGCLSVHRPGQPCMALPPVWGFWLCFCESLVWSRLCDVRSVCVYGVYMPFIFARIAFPSRLARGGCGQF